MTETKECPVCYGERKIWITDYIQRMLVEDWPIQCPACRGFGVIRLESPALIGGTV